MNDELKAARYSAVVALAFMGLLVGSSSSHAQSNFRRLGLLPNAPQSSFAWDVSADGAVVVGTASDETGVNLGAFRWTDAGGMVRLDDITIGVTNYFRGWAVSADGSAVVGAGTGALGIEAFLWSNSMTVGLGTLDGMTHSQAYGVSGDGSVVIGKGYGASGIEAFRWTVATGMVGLDFLPQENSSQAYDISVDGSVIVGWSGGEAFRWTASEGMIGLGDLPGGPFISEAYGVSANGQVIVGRGLTEHGSEAMRWTASDGMIGLGHLLPASFEPASLAWAVSDDGSVIVGRSSASSVQEAFIWDSTHGMRNLRSVLMERFGVNLAGLTLDDANGMTSDGRTIVGTLTSASAIEAWRVTLPYYPDPVDPCAMDADGNSIVGIDDFLMLLSAWGKCPAHCPSDFDLDAWVGVDDFLAVLTNWGPCP